MSDETRQLRDDRQAKLFAWACAAFGTDQSTSVAQRGVRLLEEAVEAFQAAGGDVVLAHRVVNFVFDRPRGELGQELGGVAVCTLLLAAAAGLSADAEERREAQRVLSNPIKEFTARNAAKNAAGLDALTPPAQQISGYVTTDDLRRQFGMNADASGFVTAEALLAKYLSMEGTKALLARYLQDIGMHGTEVAINTEWTLTITQPTTAKALLARMLSADDGNTGGKERRERRADAATVTARSRLPQRRRQPPRQR